MQTNSACKNILFSAVKNEGPFLLEWIAYHTAIGFDTILIVSNNCDDGTDELLDALQYAGHIIHLSHDVDENISPQGAAAAVANNSGVIFDQDWVIWLDADEFLNVHTGEGKVTDLITKLETAHGMLIPWRIFGDSGQEKFTGRLISEHFTRAAEIGYRGHPQIKTFYKHTDGATSLSRKANHRPRLTSSNYQFNDFLNGSGKPISKDFEINRKWLSGVQGRGNGNTAPPDYVMDIAQINHYIVRTREHFDLKKSRGRGFRRHRKSGSQQVRHTDKFFRKFNKNDATDVSILRFADATSSQISIYLENAAIASAYSKTIRITQDKIRKMSETSKHPPITEKEHLLTPSITLPALEAAFVKETYFNHDVILEYGSGGSTMLAAQQKHSLTMSVESDAAWADNMNKILKRDHPDSPVHIHYTDIGETRQWGRPKNARGFRKFHKYPLEIWDQEYFQHPDLVLIDGRFRVGCFMTTLLRISRPVKLLFDDYVPRPEYSVIERYAKPTQLVGRMAVFDLEPMRFPIRDMTEILGWYARTN